MAAELDNPTVRSSEDAGLVLALQRGDRAAGERFVHLYQDRIHRLLLHLVNDGELALDLTQDTLLKALTAIKDFKGQSGLMTWLYRIATNMALSQRRKSLVRKTTALDAPLGSAADPDAPTLADRLPASANQASPPMEQERLKGRLQRALARLDPESRCVLLLRDVEDLDYHQIGLTLDLPLGTVKSRLFRARQAMRELLQGTDV